MTVMTNEDPAAPEPLTDSEQAEAMTYEALVFELSVVLMRLDGNDGDPNQLVLCGGTVPEPWGDVWQKYEPQALSVLDAIGEGSARAMVAALGEREWVAQVVSSGPLANLPLLQWRSADVSLNTPIGTKLVVAPSVAGTHHDQGRVMASDETAALLRIWQTHLGETRDQCDEPGRKLWDRIEAALGVPAPARPRPLVTEFNVGRWCLSEDDCIAQGINFAAYERGVGDAAKAFGRSAQEVGGTDAR